MFYPRPYQNLIYHPWHGQLVWIKKCGRGRIPAGSIAGCVDTNSGYRRIWVNGVVESAHRIIYEMFNGPIPEGMEIDHRDGNRDNNRIDNLRLASIPQNKQNSVVHRDSKTGIKGVCWHKARQEWRAYVQCDKINRTRNFKNKQDAIDWVTALRAKLHMEFANNGIHKKDLM